MKRKRLFLWAGLAGAGLAVLFSMYDPVQVQAALQEAVGATAVQNPMNVPGFGLALASAFLVGVSMVVTPCLIPVIFTFVPASRGSESREDVLSSLVFYTAGMVAVSAVIGVLVGLLGGAIVRFLQGFGPVAKDLAVPVFSLMGAVFLLWGLRAFHLIDLPSTSLYYRLTSAIDDLSMGEGSSSFLYGAAVGTALGISCPIPTYHAVLLWAAIVGNPLFGLLLLTSLGIGRVLPLWAMVALPHDSTRALMERIQENPARIHAYNGFAITLLGSFLLVFWIGSVHLQIL